jgi:drug/metabolite transporter (DMT)-like permease
MSAFTTAVLFYILYKERLNLQHILGMIMIVVSVLIVAVFKSMQMHPSSDGNNSTDDSDLYLSAMDFEDETSMIKPEPKIKNRFFILVPMLCIAINVVWLTVGSWAARAAKGVSYPPTQFVVDYLMLAGVMYFGGFIYYHFFTS